MKRFSTTFVLAGVFVALLAVVIFYANDGADKRRQDSTENRPMLSSAQLESVTQVSFTKAGQAAVVLTRDAADPDKWLLDSAPVNRNEASLLNKTLQELSQGKRVSKNKDSWDGYGLVDGTADQVILSQNDLVLTTLYLGKPGPSYPSFYLRRDDQDLVYLVSSSLQQLVAYGAERWTVADKVETEDGVL